MRTTGPGDAARTELLLAELRLPAIKQVWASLAAQADKEGWPAGRFLAALAEHEVAERARRRLETPSRRSPAAARQALGFALVENGWRVLAPDITDHTAQPDAQET